MRRLISAKYYKGLVGVAYFEDLELKKYETISYKKEKFESLACAIESFVIRNNIKIYKIAFAMDDEECIAKLITLDKKDEYNMENNIRFQFPDFIDEDEVDDYVYDYHSVKNDEKAAQYYVVAAPKHIIEDYIGIALNINKKLDMLRPESACIGCVLSSKDAGGVIVIEVKMDEIKISIFNNKKQLATNVISLNEESIEKITLNIVKNMAYYDDKKISKNDFKVLVIGGGNYLKQIKRTIEKFSHHPVISPKEFIKGDCTQEEAAGAFSMYGTLF